MPDKIKCLIIDDEEMATRVIKSHIDAIDDFEIVGIYHSAIEAFLAIEKGAADLMFLDIEMPKITGLKMLEMLQNPPLTVLTTAHREFALEGFELEVLDYLLKPISFARFLKSTKKIKKAIGSKASTVEEVEHIFVRCNREMIKINFSDLLYVEAIKNHVKIVTIRGNYISHRGITDFYQEFDGADFIRIHRSYFVHKRHVRSFGHEHVMIQDIRLPVGRSYRENLKAILPA